MESDDDHLLKWNSTILIGRLRVSTVDLVIVTSKVEKSGEHLKID